MNLNGEKGKLIMTSTMTLEKMSETIDILKAVTKNDAEAMKVFEDNDLDFEKVTIQVDDVIFGLKEVHSILYNHKADDIYLENLIKCKDHYYSKGHIEWEIDNFIEATECIFDVVIGNDDVDTIREIAESIFGESFIDLFSTQKFNENSKHTYHLKMYYVMGLALSNSKTTSKCNDLMAEIHKEIESFSKDELLDIILKNPTTKKDFTKIISDRVN